MTGILDPRDLLYGQQNRWSEDWLRRRYGQTHTIPLEETPHVLALRGDADTYIAFLETTRWSGIRTSRYRARRLQRFRATARSVSADGVLISIQVVRRRDGRWLLLNGVHRAAAALVSGQPVPYREWQPDVWRAHVLAVRDPRTAHLQLEALDT
jgi:hypothetical protein